jgi:hypothetical protein
MAAMARPVVVVVDDEDASRQALARELERRYGAHYRIMPSVSPEEAHRPQQAIIASPAHQSTTRRCVSQQRIKHAR